MKLSRTTWAAVAVLGLALAAPGSAAVAAPATSEVRAAYANCEGVAVTSIANNLPIFERPSITSARLHTVQRGDFLYCRGQHAVELGGRYDACGVTRANGWLNVKVPGTTDE